MCLCYTRYRENISAYKIFINVLTLIREAKTLYRKLRRLSMKFGTVNVYMGKENRKILLNSHIWLFENFTINWFI